MVSEHPHTTMPGGPTYC